jgi:preprotein translocase subunit SecE
MRVFFDVIFPNRKMLHNIVIVFLLSSFFFQIFQECRKEIKGFKVEALSFTS